MSVLDDGLCVECGRPTNSYSGNPDEWPLLLPIESEPGIPKYHHTGCVLKWREDLQKLRGPKCKETDCPDHDGNHPYHFNAVERFWVSVQDTYEGRANSVPTVDLWRRERALLKAQVDEARKECQAMLSDKMDEVIKR